MSFTVLPPQQDNRGSFGRGLMEGLSGGISRLHEQLAKHREQGHLKNIMGEWKDNTSTEEKLMSLAAAPVSSESKAFMGNVLLHMEDVKQKKEASRLANQYKYAKEASKYITPEQAQMLGPALGVDPRQLVGQPLTVANALGNARRDSPESVGAKAEVQAQAKAGIKHAADYYTKLTENKSKLMESQRAINEARSGLSSTGATARNMAYKYLKNKKNPLAEALLSDDMQKVELAGKTIMGSVKDLVARPTEKEFFWYESAVAPSVLKSPEVNKYLLEHAEKFTQLQLKAIDVAEQIRREHDGNIPKDIDLQVADRMQKDVHEFIMDAFRNSDEIVQVRFKKDGITYPVPAKEAAKFIESGEVELVEPSERI